MKSSMILFLAISTLSLSSCNSQDKKNKVVNEKKSNNVKSKDFKQYSGTWLYVEKKNNEYLYCADISKSITATNYTIHDETPIEDSDFKIDHVKEMDGSTYLYLDKKEISYYRFKWIDEEKGISEWILNNYQREIYVNHLKVNNVKKSKCEQKEITKGVVCEINSLSSKFNFKIIGTDFENKEKSLNPLIANIIIIPKNNPSKTQEICFEPSSWTSFNDIPCYAISYFKREKSIKESLENHHNFIIADYNFDGLEDFAYIWDVGGNGGVLFSYFFQNKQGEFFEDDSFPLKNGLFPFEINVEKKKLITMNPVGCCKINKMIYQLKENNKWELIQSRQEDIK